MLKKAALALLTFLPHITKENVGQVATVLGIVGTVFAGLKTIANWIANQTISRKRRKASEDINTYMELLRKYEGAHAGDDVENFSVYKEEIRDNLKEALSSLKSAREQMAYMQAKRVQEPEGATKLFLLYRPLDLDGWLTHICFYSLIVILATVGFWWLRQPSRTGDPVGFLFAILMGEIYLSEAANRIRRYSLIKKGGIINPDKLTWLKRNLLWSHPKNLDAWLDRFFFYIFGVWFLVGAIAFIWNFAFLTIHDIGKISALLVLPVLLMRIVRADAFAIEAGDSFAAAALSRKVETAPVNQA